MQHTPSRERAHAHMPHLHIEADTGFLIGVYAIGLGALMFVISICTVHLTVWLFVLSFIAMIGGTVFMSRVYTGTR